jgi:hypothetical protein
LCGVVLRSPWDLAVHCDTTKELSLQVKKVVVFPRQSVGVR